MCACQHTVLVRAHSNSTMVHPEVQKIKYKTQSPVKYHLYVSSIQTGVMAVHGLPLNWRLPWIQLQIRCQTAKRQNILSIKCGSNNCSNVQKHTIIGNILEQYVPKR